jgi:hypothetical protein
VQEEVGTREKNMSTEVQFLKEQLERTTDAHKANETRLKMQLTAATLSLEKAEERTRALETENSRIPLLEDARERLSILEKENDALRKVLKKNVTRGGEGRKKRKTKSSKSTKSTKSRKRELSPPPPLPAPAAPLAPPPMLNSPRQLLRASTLLEGIQSKEGTLRHVVRSVLSTSFPVS